MYQQFQNKTMERDISDSDSEFSSYEKGVGKIKLCLLFSTTIYIQNYRLCKTPLFLNCPLLWKYTYKTKHLQSNLLLLI